MDEELVKMGSLWSSEYDTLYMLCRVEIDVSSNLDALCLINIEDGNLWDNPFRALKVMVNGSAHYKKETVLCHAGRSFEYVRRSAEEAIEWNKFPEIVHGCTKRVLNFFQVDPDTSLNSKAISLRFIEYMSGLSRSDAIRYYHKLTNDNDGS